MRYFLLLFFLVGCSEAKTSCCCCQCPKPVEVKTVYVQKPKYSLDKMLSNVMIWLNETSPATPSR
jgi:hypothetical protein